MPRPATIAHPGAISSGHTLATGKSLSCRTTAPRYHASGPPFAATLNDQAQGAAQMSTKFNEIGGQVYLDADKVKERNKAF